MSKESIAQSFQELVEVFRQLRDPETGCPWDLKQTHESLKPFLIEEAYELLEAIDESPAALREELGDVLLQVMLHSQLAADAGHFSVAEVVEDLKQKMIARHPHVFGDQKAQNADEVLTHWDQAKQVEKQRKSLLEGIPQALPALMRAQKIGKRTEKVGFDWENPSQVIHVLRDEAAELETALSQNLEDASEELGDVLFTAAQIARQMNLDAELCLQQANEKFTRRFQAMEEMSDKPLKDLSFDALQELWEAVKASEKKEEKNERTEKNRPPS